MLLPRSTDAVEQAHARFSAWCCSAGIGAPSAHSRHHRFNRRGGTVTWELHTEFVTLTWTTAPDERGDWPDDIGISALETGDLLVATAIETATHHDPHDQALVSEQSYCASVVEGGAIVTTNFVVGADRFTRYRIAIGTLAVSRRAVLIRTVLEIETYRSFALLGLPLVRAMMPELNALEAGLAGVVESMADSTRRLDDQDALSALHDLSVRAGRLGEHTAYRFAASAAYGRLLANRLDSLNETALPGAATLSSYLGHRTEPALATCLAVEKRQAALAEKIHRATELLDTRIGLKIEAQNQSVLTTIAHTAASQFRLQRTVEGLSVIAISYYLLGIVSYMLSGIGEVAHFAKPLVLGACAPIVLIATWAALRLAEARSARRWDNNKPMP